MGKRLCQAVETWFYYNTPVLGGQTWNEVRVSHGATVKNPKLLNTDQKYWSWFFDLHGARAYSDGVPQAISFTEISAWRQLLSEPVAPHHVKLLRKMDTAFLAAILKVQKEREANK